MEKIPLNIGERYGMLVVQARLEPEYYAPKKGWRYFYEVVCDCGNVLRMRKDSILYQNKGCGCQQRYRHQVRHGMSYSRMYGIWHGMKARCQDRTNTRYGGKGVIVCDEWKEFEPFQEWAVANGYDEKMTIDRIDSGGNYEPANCQWLSWKDHQAKTHADRLLKKL